MDNNYKIICDLKFKTKAVEDKGLPGAASLTAANAQREPHAYSKMGMPISDRLDLTGILS